MIPRPERQMIGGHATSVQQQGLAAHFNPKRRSGKMRPILVVRDPNGLISAQFKPLHIRSE